MCDVIRPILILAAYRCGPVAKAPLRVGVPTHGLRPAHVRGRGSTRCERTGLGRYATRLRRPISDRKEYTKTLRAPRRPWRAAWATDTHAGEIGGADHPVPPKLLGRQSTRRNKIKNATTRNLQLICRLFSGKHKKNIRHKG